MSYVAYNILLHKPSDELLSNPLPSMELFLEARSAVSESRLSNPSPSHHL